MDLSLPSRSMAEIALKIWQLLASVLFAGTYGYWQQMKTTEAGIQLKKVSHS